MLRRQCELFKDLNPCYLGLSCLSNFKGLLGRSRVCLLLDFWISIVIMFKDLVHLQSKTNKSISAKATGKCKLTPCPLFGNIKAISQYEEYTKAMQLCD